MKGRYILCEKKLESGKVIRRNFPIQSWNALKPGSLGLNGWTEVVNNPIVSDAVKFPEQEKTPTTYVPKESIEIVKTAVPVDDIDFPKEIPNIKYLEAKAHQWLLKYANYLAKEKGLSPIKIQKKPELLGLIDGMR